MQDFYSVKTGIRIMWEIIEFACSIKEGHLESF